MKKSYFLFIALLSLAACKTTSTKPEGTTTQSSLSQTLSANVEMTETTETTLVVPESQAPLSGKIAVNDITLEPIDVYERVLASYPDLRIYSFGLDDDHTHGFVYEVDGIVGSTNQKIELDIHPVSGEIVRKEEKTSHSKDQMKMALTRELILNIPNLVEQALAQVTNGTLGEWEAEYDDGRFELEIAVHFGNRTIAFTYDLETNELLEMDE